MKDLLASSPFHRSKENMKNINSTVYGKIIIQAQEAKEIGLEKLGERVLSVISPAPRDENEKISYSHDELTEDFNRKLWKMALDVIAYHDLESVDIQKVDETIRRLSEVINKELGQAMGTESVFGAFEPPVLGERE